MLKSGNYGQDLILASRKIITELKLGGKHSDMQIPVGTSVKTEFGMKTQPSSDMVILHVEEKTAQERASRDTWNAIINCKKV